MEENNTLCLKHNFFSYIPPTRNRSQPPEINSTHTNDDEQDTSDKGGLIKEKLRRSPKRTKLEIILKTKRNRRRR
jgi:hypothetical protein